MAYFCRKTTWPRRLVSSKKQTKFSVNNEWYLINPTSSLSKQLQIGNIFRHANKASEPGSGNDIANHQKPVCDGSWNLQLFVIATTPFLDIDLWNAIRTMLRSMQKLCCLYISMPTFIIVCSFIRETILFSFSSWLSTTIILFTFLGKVLGYFPFTSVLFCRI